MQSTTAWEVERDRGSMGRWSVSRNCQFFFLFGDD